MKQATTRHISYSLLSPAFQHRKMWRFLKRVSHKGITVHVTLLIQGDNGARSKTERTFRIESIEHDKDDFDSRHNYVINGDFSFEIPETARELTEPNGFGYYWIYEGPICLVLFEKERNND